MGIKCSFQLTVLATIDLRKIFASGNKQFPGWILRPHLFLCQINVTLAEKKLDNIEKHREYTWKSLNDSTAERDVRYFQT